MSCQAELPVISGKQTTAYQADDQPPLDTGYQPIQPPAPFYGQSSVQDWQQAGADKKIVAGILGIVVGGLGIHKFILGYQKEGMTMLLVSVLSCFTLSACMHVIGMIEGIMYLTRSDRELVRTYLYGRRCRLRLLVIRVALR